MSDEQELGRYIRSLDSASNARQERLISQQSNMAGAEDSDVDGGIARRRNPEAMFARLDGSDSDEVKGGPAMAAAQQRKRGKASSVAGSIRPTNAWR